MITKTLAAFVTNFEYESIPEDAKQFARHAILDYIGVTLAGSRSKTGKAVAEYVRESGGGAEATVIGQGFQSSPYAAALANGTMGHALDYDDECETWNSHPTVAILPPILALGEKLSSSGREMLEAYLMGWEISAALGRSTFFRFVERGLHTTAFVGSISAAAVSAKLLGLSDYQVRMAIGIAASEASGLISNFGSDSKPLNAGLAASNGVRAADLALLGFTANPEMLDGRLGFFGATTGEELPPEELDGMGSSFDIVESLCIKYYPTCYANMRPLDSIFHLIREHHIQVNDVESVEVLAHPLQIEVMPYVRPKTGLEGKFSLQYSMAAALTYGRVSLEEFEDDKVLDTRIQDLLSRVKVTPIPGEVLADYSHCAPGQSVKVRMKSGEEYQYDAGCPKGHSDNPMTWEEILAKFETTAGGTLSPDVTQRVASLVAKFEDIPDARSLMALL